MGDKVLDQLLELTRAFNRIEIKPLICGGLGIFLGFHGRPSEVPLRTTNDIDLMLTKAQVFEEFRRRVIADIITGELNYVVCESGKHFQFRKGDQYLDILTQQVDGIDAKNFRAILVKSKLHGYLTPEACFIEEKPRTIKLSDIMPDNNRADGLEVQVPSPTNQLILKLFAFDDKCEGQRKDDDQAQDHAFDIYVIVTLANMDDYKQGRELLARHNDSPIIKRSQSIAEKRFSSLGHVGWRYVLKASNFYPNLNVQQKQERLDEAKRRLVRWFAVSGRD